MSSSKPQSVSSTFKVLANLYHDDKTKDITVWIGDQSFLCHKTLLTTCSEYFDSMFKSGMKEDGKAEIHLEESEAISAGLFEIILRYCYTREVNLKKENVSDILTFAVYLQITELEKLCFDFVKALIESSEIPETDLVKWLLLSSEYSEPMLKKMVTRSIARNFLQVAESDEFLEYITIDKLKEIINDEHLNIPEYQIFRRVKTWLEHKEERKLAMLDILRHLRLGRLTRQHLQEVFEFVLASASHHRDEILLELFEIQAVVSKNDMGSAIGIQEKYPNYFLEIQPEEVLYAIDTSHAAYRWNVQNGEMTKKLQMNDKSNQSINQSTRRGFGSSVTTPYAFSCIFESVTGKLYFISGSSFWEFDSTTGSYNILSKTQNDGQHVVLLCKDKKLYAIGGSNNRSCEVFDLEKNEWLEGMASIPGPGDFKSCRVALFKSEIFALVYHSNPKCYCLYSYDAKVNTWSFLKIWEFKTSCERFGFCKINGHIYACLGNVYAKLCVYDICCKFKLIPQPNIPSARNNDDPLALEMNGKVYIALKDAMTLETDVKIESYLPHLVCLGRWNKMTNDFYFFKARKDFFEIKKGED